MPFPLSRRKSSLIRASSFLAAATTLVLTISIIANSAGFAAAAAAAAASFRPPRLAFVVRVTASSSSSSSASYSVISSALRPPSSSSLLPLSTRAAEGVRSRRFRILAASPNMMNTSATASLSSSRDVSAPDEETAPPLATQTTVVDLLELAAASVVACVTASRKIKWLLDRKNTRRKADGSFVTDADYSAQGVIVEAIRRVSASVRIIGEESAEEMQVHVGRFEEEEQEGDKGNQDQRESKAEMYRRLDQDILERTREELRIRLRSAGVESKGGDSSDDTAAESSCGPAATLPLSETPVLPEKDARIAGANNSPAASSAPHPLPGTSREATPAATGPPPESSAAAAVVDVSRVSVIVDPLDGTKSYAHGDYDSVSILIGIVLDGHDPCFGVIGKPFGYTGLTPIRDTGCVAIYGGSLVKGVYVAGRALPVLPPPLPLQEGKYDRSASPNDGACPPPPELRADQEPANKRQKRRMLPRAVISSSRSRGVVEEFCSHLGQQGLIDPEPMLISGAGEKSLRLILGTNNEALWFFPKGGTSRWDVAAPDALLRQLGGKITDKHGNFLDYSKDREDAENVEGIIASNDANLHAECIRLFLEGDWVDRD